MPDPAEAVETIIAKEFGIDESEIVPEAQLQGDLDLDSIDLVWLAMELEDMFGIRIPDDKLERVETVGDVIELVAGG